MNVSAPSIRRPIATVLLSIAVAISGVLGYLSLPVSSLPQVDFPTIQVTTQLPGANPQTVADLVTAPLERQLGQISAVTALTSSSAFGLSQITIQFDLDRDIDAAAQDVQSAINAAASTLPKTLPYPPVYAKVNPADVPIMTIAITSSTTTIRELSDLADTLLGQRLSQISGVGHVTVQGGAKPAVRISADLERLASYKIGLEDLRSAISGANVNGPKGFFDGPKQSYTIAANDQITAAETYRDIVVAYRNGAPIRLKDVAEISEGLENAKVGAWYKGVPAVVFDVQRQPGANVVETVKRIRAELPRLSQALPAGAKLSIVSDRTDMIQASIHDVEMTLVIAIGLVTLVVLFFLGTWRATVIAGVGLPLSIVATFATMYFAGFSIDNLSLMALTIATGFVVDDAIVMIENVVRHIEKGETPYNAALKGSAEIGFTVISLTASLVAVFIPLLFMSGIVGRMFREFAMTLTLTVVVSAVISLTLTPMMCAFLLKPGKGPHGGDASKDEREARGLVGALVRGYRWSLEAVVRHSALTLLMTAATLAATVWLYVVSPKGFLPLQDTGLVTATLEAEPTVSFAEMVRRQTALAQAVEKDPDVTGVVSVAGVGTVNSAPNVGRLTIVLRPKDDRASSIEAVIDRLKQAATTVPGISAVFLASQDIQITTRAARAQYQYTLTGSDRTKVLQEARLVADRLARDKALTDVGSPAAANGLALMVDVDRMAMGRLGVSQQSINDTLYDAFGQRQISTIYGQANQYRVILEAMSRFQTDPSSLGRLYLPGSGGTQVPIGSVARIEHTTAPLVLENQDQFPAATISFNLAPGTSLGDAVAAIRIAEAELGRTGSGGQIVGTFSGEAAEFAKSLENEPWLILAAVVAIYIVLGVLYESAIHPVTILSTLPSAGVGALLALDLTGHDLSIIGIIGIVLLMGIVKKNAIMMIDFAIEAERERGLSPRDAILEAAMLRFRPIMMTTLAALFGAVPLALSTGAGSELRVPLGITIIGGLIVSQLLTLFTTPVIYLMMERIRIALTPGRPHEPTVAAALSDGRAGE
ncbi:efflux RND transporter permease subunit [Methyloraptor flagellatus]|uniref:Efflux RND transporter permease subunit n=1 Tax=Methyloraptor flagellatus TaxID=3162530 RepID=A0AAU7X7A6_9HYPH